MKVSIWALFLSACLNSNAFAAEEIDLQRLTCIMSPLVQGIIATQEKTISALPFNEIEALAKQDLSNPSVRVANRVLGLRYQNGVGVPRDQERAFQLYRSAAIQVIGARSPSFGDMGGQVLPADPVAMERLGRMYVRGRGATADPNGYALIACAALLVSATSTR